MGTRRYCDICKKVTKGILAYQVCAKLEIMPDDIDSGGEESCEYEYLDLCKDCANKAIADTKEFIKKYKKEE